MGSHAKSVRSDVKKDRIKIYTYSLHSLFWSLREIDVSVVTD